MKSRDFERDQHEKWASYMHSLNPDLDPMAQRLMEEMRMTARALHHIGESSVEASGLSYAKYRLLMSLLYSEQVENRRELNPSEISERQGTSRNTISALIRDLEEEGLVERSLDQLDRRKFNIGLTEGGRARVQEHMRRHVRMIGECFASLDKRDQDILNRLLARIRQSAMLARES